MHWVIVKGARYPVDSASRPDNSDGIAVSCSAFSSSGFFASVVVNNSEEPFTGKDVMPLNRGHGLPPKFEMAVVAPLD